ncbi:MAG TPA: hypothetical protein PKL96_02580 [Bacteroidales bacterium]|nr:hypothetical protein [Bacteroidales bacterium]HPS26469.1 hypothetical protein [Bacteroidales bacterium]
MKEEKDRYVVLNGNSVFDLWRLKCDALATIGEYFWKFGVLYQGNSSRKLIRILMKIFAATTLAVSLAFVLKKTVLFEMKKTASFFPVAIWIWPYCPGNNGYDMLIGCINCA